MVRKLTKKQEKEFIIKCLNMNLKKIKEDYERHIDALVKYDMESLPSSAVYSDELFSKELVRTSLLGGQSAFMRYTFGKPKRTEEEIIKDNIEYYKSLTNLCHRRFDLMNHKEKKRIAKDTIEKFHMYLKMSNENDDLRSKKEEEKKKKKIKKKNETNKKERKQS